MRKPRSPVPWPVRSRASYRAAVRGRVKALLPKAKVVEVALSRLVAIQRTVFTMRLLEYEGAGGSERLPVVVRVGGVLHIHNGHHRLMAALGAGRKTLPVRLVDLDAAERRASRKRSA